MRVVVAESSTYWWAGQMLRDVAGLGASARVSVYHSHDRRDRRIPA
jgi:hypothetical protein